MKHASMVHFKELQVLMNLLPERKMEVSYPLYDFPLMRPRPGPDGYLLDIPHSLPFDGSTERFGEMNSEVPSFYDLRECMISSGILCIRNIDGVSESLNRYRKLRNGAKFALDTNMLYNNFVQNHDIIKPSEVILVDTLREEVKSKMNRKYTSAEIADLKACAQRNSDLFDELRNRRKKAARRASIAQGEWEYLKRNDARLIPPIRESSMTGEGNDRIIVETVREYDSKNTEHVVLLTCDDAIIDLCKVESIEYIKCDLPSSVASVECSFLDFTKLVYDLAKVFGFISVGPTVIYGEYGGYTSNKPDLLKVITHNGQLHEELEKELSTCRALKEIGIRR